MVIVCLMLAPFKPKPSPGHPLDFRPVFRNRAALGYIFGYGAHCFELYGMRTWIVAFWTFVAARNAGDVLLGPVAVSVLVTVLSLPASVLGNEASIRFGRHRAITVIMFASAAVAIAIGCSATLSPLVLLLALVLLYGLTVPGDSGSLTVGHEPKRGPRQSRRDNGAAFDRRLRTFGVWRLGHWRGPGRGGRTCQCHRMARRVLAACGGRVARTDCASVVDRASIGRTQNELRRWVATIHIARRSTMS